MLEDQRCRLEEMTGSVTVATDSDGDIHKTDIGDIVRTYSSSSARPSLEVDGHLVGYSRGWWTFRKALRVGQIMVWRYQEQVRGRGWVTRQEKAFKVTHVSPGALTLKSISVPSSPSVAKTQSKPKGRSASSRSIAYAVSMLRKVSPTAWLDADTPGPKPSAEDLQSWNQTDISDLIDDLRVLTGRA